MPIDPSIAMGVRPLEVPNQLAQYGQLMQLQQGQQASQLNQMKMQEYQRGVQEQNAMRGIISQPGFDPMNPAHQNQLYSVAPSLAPKYIEQVLTTKESAGKITAADIKAKTDKDSMLSQSYRDISRNPSDAQITAHMEDVLASSLFSPTEKASIQSTATGLLAMPFDKRQQIMSMHGAKASDLKPQVVAPGASLVPVGTTTPTYTQPVAPSSLEKEYDRAKKEGFAGTLFDFKKQLAEAGSTKINMPPVAKSLAGPVGSMAEASLAQAKGSIETMNNANAVREALNTGNVIAGPMAGVRTKFAQVMDLAGAGDKEKLAATRSAIQGLAAITLESRSALKGQGQITDFETGLLEKARSGNIADMTIGELHTVVDVSQRLAQRQSGNHETLMTKMRKDPNAQDVLPYYEVGAKLPAPVLTGKPKAVDEKRKAGLANIFGSQ